MPIDMGADLADRQVSSDTEAAGAFKVGGRTVRRAKRIRRRSRNRFEAIKRGTATVDAVERSPDRYTLRRR